MLPRPIDDAEALPAVGGAYLLVIDLPRPILVQLPGYAAVTLEEGCYLYAGSARGPGGIRARVRRHLKGAKPLRWHIDRLTNMAGVAAVFAYPDGNECTLTSSALAVEGVAVPAPGFGSSDCRHCAAHLLQLPDSLAPEDLVSRLAGPPPAVQWRRPPVLCFWRPPPRG